MKTDILISIALVLILLGYGIFFVLGGWKLLKDLWKERT